MDWKPLAAHVSGTGRAGVCERARVHVCVHSLVPMSWGNLPPSRGDGKVYIKGGRQRLLEIFFLLRNWMNLLNESSPGFGITLLVLITSLAASQGGILELSLCGEDTVCLSPLGPLALCKHQLSAKLNHLPSLTSLPREP